MNQKKTVLGPFRPHIHIGARNSPLSKAQTFEVIYPLLFLYPTVSFTITTLLTCGDLDKKTPLHAVKKDTFFTQELDELVQNHIIDIAIHSAKDLPKILPDTLAIFAITGGVSSADVLITRPGEQPLTLPSNAKIGTSSLKRMSRVHLLRHDFVPYPIRGTIEERLHQLYQGTIDALIMAYAAIIRLNLYQLPHLLLPFPTEPLQGKIAVVGRSEDIVTASLFSSMNKNHL